MKERRKQVCASLRVYQEVTNSHNHAKTIFIISVLYKLSGTSIKLFSKKLFIHNFESEHIPRSTELEKLFWYSFQQINIGFQVLSRVVWPLSQEIYYSTECLALWLPPFRIELRQRPIELH